MPASSIAVRTFTAPRALTVAALASVVAVLGALIRGTIAFVPGVALSAVLAFITLAVAVRSGRRALDSGDPARAGAIAGGMLAVRFLGSALLMLAAFMAPRLVDLWGVVAGMAVVDVTLVADEALGAIAAPSSDPAGASPRDCDERGCDT